MFDEPGSGNGDEDEVRRDLMYGYSDRCRYYWNQPAVQEEIARLIGNLGRRPIPLPLVSQRLPLEYAAIPSGELQAVPERMIQITFDEFCMCTLTRA